MSRAVPKSPIQSRRVPEHEPAAWITDALRGIERLASLPANWDSYGAARVLPESIAKAREVVGELALIRGIAKPEITATPEGHVGLCWDDGAQSLDVSVDPTGLLHYAFLGRSPEQERSGQTKTLHELIPLLVSD